MLHYDKRALKRLMAARDMRHQEVARRAKLSQRTVYYLMHGMTNPKANTIAKLANVLEVEIEAFFRRVA